MTYRLVYTDSYVRRAKKCIKRHPQILGQYEKTLQLLAFDQFIGQLDFVALARPISRS